MSSNVTDNHTSPQNSFENDRTGGLGGRAGVGDVVRDASEHMFRN